MSNGAHVNHEITFGLLCYHLMLTLKEKESKSFWKCSFSSQMDKSQHLKKYLLEKMLRITSSGCSLPEFCMEIDNGPLREEMCNSVTLNWLHMCTARHWNGFILDVWDIEMMLFMLFETLKWSCLLLVKTRRCCSNWLELSIWRHCMS